MYKLQDTHRSLTMASVQVWRIPLINAIGIEPNDLIQ